MSENFYISKRNENIKDILEGFLDTKFFGIIYGKPLTGKTYFTKNFLNDQYINYYYIDLLNQNLTAEVSELVVDEYTILVVDNAQLLMYEDMEKLLYLYNEYKNLAIILVGNEELKEKITKGEFNKFITDFNFILEWKELNFSEFKDFLKNYMSEKGISIHFTKRALKNFFKKSEGKIGKVVYLLYKYKDKKFVYKVNKLVILFPLILIILFSGYFYIIEVKKDNAELEKSQNSIVQIPKENKKFEKKKLNIGYMYDEKNKECYNFLDSFYTLLNNDKKEKYIYFISLGAFRNKNNAEKLYRKIKKKYNYELEIFKDEKKGYYKVRFRFYNINEAKSVLGIIKKDIKNAFLAKVKE